MKIKSAIICILTFILIFAGIKTLAGEGENLVNNGYVYEKDEQSVSIGYPAVDKLEVKVFGQAYPGQNIYSRLDRLETSVFGRKNNANLSERVDRLDEYLFGSKRYTIGSNSESFNNYSSSNSFSNGFNNRNSYSSGGSNITFGSGYRDTSRFGDLSSSEYSGVLYDLENEFLNATYSGEPANVRVTRLENHLFSSSMEGYPMEDRIQRLVAYADARDSDDFYDDQVKTAKYSQFANGANAISLLFMILQFFL